MRIFKPKTNLFDMTHQYYTTVDFGDFVPFDVIEVLPGDTWKVNPHALCRLEALQAPTMMDCKMMVNYFYVPNRLVWNEWDTFITRGKDGLAEPVMPFIKDMVVKNGSVADYMGLPKKLPGATSDVVIPKVSALPFRMYNKIINDWVIHSVIEDERVFSMESGEDTTTDLSLFSKGWSPDRFTRCLPYPQLGPDVKIPLGDKADIYGQGGALGVANMNVADNPTTYSFVPKTNAFLMNGKTKYDAGKKYPLSNSDIDNGPFVPHDTATVLMNYGYGKFDGAYADLKGASAGATMRAFRISQALQKFFELNARVGSRIVENLLGHWGVRSDDLRLQRSEYLGGAVSNVLTSEVIQTSQSTDNSPQGTLAGHGWTSNYSKFTRRFKEHGFIIGIVSVMPRAVYSQGVEKKWLRESVFDYPDPLLAHLSEQPVYEQEIVAGTSDPKKIFGFLPIFDECRHIENRVTGNFTGNLSFWVHQRLFTDNTGKEPKAPALNAAFLRGKPSKDIFAVTDTSPEAKALRIAVNIQATVARKLPKEGIPL